MMMGFGLFGAIFMLAFWGGLIALAVWVARELFGSRRRSDVGGVATPREILDMRYARGEISKEEYDLMLRDLTGPAAR